MAVDQLLEESRSVYSVGCPLARRGCSPMIAALAFASTLVGQGTIMYKAPFDDVIREYRAYPEAMARSTARPFPAIDGYMTRVVECFRESRSPLPALDSVRFAVRLRDGWLVADKYGIASWGRRRGYLDVVRLEQVLAEAGMPAKTRSQRLELNVSNNGKHTVRVRIGPARILSDIPAGRSQTMTLWHTSLTFSSDGTNIGAYTPWKTSPLGGKFFAKSLRTTSEGVKQLVVVVQ